MSKETVSELKATQIHLALVEIENVQLKLTQLQAIGQELLRKRDTLIQDARVEVSAPTDWLYNTETLGFQPPEPKPQEPSTAPESKKKGGR